MNNQVYLELEKVLKLKGYAAKTIQAYVFHIRRFSNYTGKDLILIELEDIEKYVLYLLETKNSSPSYVNVFISSMKFLLKYVLKRADIEPDIFRVKKSKKLPDVLSQDEVSMILGSVENLKHRAILNLVYSSGLRVSEVSSLKIADIDSKLMRIHIRDAKGGKDRYTILSEKALILLREYYRSYRPKEYLFDGAGAEADKPISVRSVQKIFEKAVIKAGIKKQVGIHGLRHGFAVSLLESGVDIRIIQELLGHSNISTTQVYLHISQEHLRGIRSPLDALSNA